MDANAALKALCQAAYEAISSLFLKLLTINKNKVLQNLTT
jgi:hypothetical protein